jgi:hypothetical protein
MNTHLETPQFSTFENCGTCGNSTNKDRVPQFSPYPPPEGGGMDRELWNRGMRRGSFPENRGEPAGTAELWAHRRQLEADLAQCLTELEAAEEAADRTGTACWSAWNSLSALFEQGRQDYATVLRPAYEHWRIASFKHYPFKKSERALEDWHGAILKELAEVNAEIDKPKSPRFSRKRTAENRGDLLL